MPLSQQWVSQIKKEPSFKTRDHMFLLHRINFAQEMEENLSPEHLHRWKVVKKIFFSSTDHFDHTKVNIDDLPGSSSGVSAFIPAQHSIFYLQDIPQIILNQIEEISETSHLPLFASLHNSLHETLKDIASDVSPQWPVLEGLTEEDCRQIESPLFRLYLGIGYMYASQYVNLFIAESLLKKASKQFTNHIHSTFYQLDPHTADNNEILELDQYLLLGSETYFLIGIISFLQAEFKEALSFINKAISLYPEFKSATFLKAKILLAMKKEEETLSLLKALFAEDPYALDYICLELDFILNPIIFSWMQDLYLKKHKKVKEKISEIKENLVPNSQAKEALRNIENLANEESYFFLLEAERFLEEENDFHIEEAISGSAEYPYITSEVLTLPIKDFVEKENDYARRLPAVKARLAEIATNSEAKPGKEKWLWGAGGIALLLCLDLYFFHFSTSVLDGRIIKVVYIGILAAIGYKFLEPYLAKKYPYDEAGGFLKQQRNRRIILGTSLGLISLLFSTGGLLFSSFSQKNSAPSASYSQNTKNAAPSSQKAFVVSRVDELRIRQQPHADAKVVEGLDEGERATWLAQSNSRYTSSLRGQTLTAPWYRVRSAQGIEGWVFGGGVTFEPGSILNPRAIINDPDGYTNLRAGASTKTSILGRISKGELFEVLSQSSKWWRVKTLDGKTGYVHSSRIQLFDTPPGQYSFVSIRPLSQGDLVNYTQAQLRLMRCEVLARYGYRFKSNDLRRYFSNQAWYNSRYDEVDHMLSELEKKNVQLILNTERNGFYIISISATDTKAKARRVAKQMQDKGYESGFLWIPDYPSLSGTKMYAVYLGPFATQEVCAREVAAYRRIQPSAYGIWVGFERKRIEVRGPGRIKRKSY
jgi:tetratricopeptide (TPR) repeat protein